MLITLSVDHYSLSIDHAFGHVYFQNSFNRHNLNRAWNRFDNISITRLQVRHKLVLTFAPRHSRHASLYFLPFPKQSKQKAYGTSPCVGTPFVNFILWPLPLHVVHSVKDEFTRTPLPLHTRQIMFFSIGNSFTQPSRNSSLETLSR